MAEKDVFMAEKGHTFNSFVSRTPMITLDKLTGSKNYLKDELTYILSKSTNTETSQSKMIRVFMIILLLNLGPNFENIQEQILTGEVIPNFDEALTRLLRHTSTAT